MKALVLLVLVVVSLVFSLVVDDMDMACRDTGTVATNRKR